MATSPSVVFAFAWALGALMVTNALGLALVFGTNFDRGVGRG